MHPESQQSVPPSKVFDHAYWMQVAIDTAYLGFGMTSPNPPVGAVIVKDGLELGRGYHKKAGLPHAEREAIAAVKAHHGPDALKGATIYVTLEPCSTAGRTPACTDGIIEHGMTHVVYGSEDPNPKHVGAAQRLLSAANIQVTTGVLEADCDRLIRRFTKHMTTGMPWVIAKTAMSLDGRITRPPSEGQWLTGPDSREIVHQLRAEVDAIVVGGKTVRRDNPRLTLRSQTTSPDKEQPWRAVLTHSGRQSLPEERHLFTDAHKNRTILYQDQPLAEVIRDLGDRGCTAVLLECGGRLMRQFVEEDLIDEYYLFYAPIITGGEDFGFGIGHHLPRSFSLVEVQSQQVDQDTLIRGIVDRLQ
ncbi:bifunctional diaminohydroxyphosphoribosylaminopyrimidine deaminase/5-amino-6-(5-phosphoribosylamino)uracil reductase RibD [Rubritalea marina]|uniref:bifunctional diaminohydroxyphosphoribosylaminopyrimidine deaminase/5-amino-6-(5-phosphoribosylamino)uracil reductase RibD n=1 Tax=Rubritalea marina TaxID=361055 RepID=UPI00036A1BFF|nr:bifunctional diaminohydroxyphosphoribosylaminopyrimidine deaminase/5-amino-6-(5-phosphoribosylamino)uracil reductase RibD [Rubritalea marina]